MRYIIPIRHDAISRDILLDTGDLFRVIEHKGWCLYYSLNVSVLREALSARCFYFSRQFFTHVLSPRAWLYLKCASYLNKPTQNKVMKHFLFLFHHVSYLLFRFSSFILLLDPLNFTFHFIPTIIRVDIKVLYVNGIQLILFNLSFLRLDHSRICQCLPLTLISQFPIARSSFHWIQIAPKISFIFMNFPQ